MHPVDLLAPVSPISWDNIALRGVTSSDQSRAHEKRLNSTVYGYSFLLATLIQLNRQEGRHSLARATFHGKKGEIRQPYREGQEDQLGALGLVVNTIALWNTRYMDLALDQLRATGNVLWDGDIERLSPLVHEHINLHGRYYFGLTEALQRGELRALRDPRNAMQEL